MRFADRIHEAVRSMGDRIARAPGGDDDVRWRRYVWVLLSGSLLFYLAAVAFIAAVDPWKVLPASAAIERPMSGLNQRLFFPMLVRTGRFDSFIFGNSTAMLIDPEHLGREFGGRFANLTMGDAQAWEQLELLRFVLTEQPKPRTLMFTLDWVWCVPELERPESETRRFPVWVYREPSWRNIRRLLNLDALLHAVNAVKYQFGRYRPTFRRDGYWIFTQPDETYNAEAALMKIYGGAGRRSPPPPLEPPETVPAEVKKAWAFPWLDRMTQALEQAPETTQVLFVTMPVHAIAQPQPGSAAAQREEACKQRIARIAASRGSFLIDFRIRSEVTRTDANYWDGLHYRVPVARRLEQAVAAAARSGQPDPGGFWRIVDAR